MFVTLPDEGETAGVGYPVTIIPPVLRSEYLAAVKDSNTGNLAPFTKLLSNMVWESQRDYLRLLQSLERK